MTLEEKKAAWQKELNENEEFLNWFYGNGSINSGAQAYMGSLEWQAYDHQAQATEKKNKELKRKLRYTRQ